MSSICFIIFFCYISLWITFSKYWSFACLRYNATVTDLIKLDREYFSSWIRMNLLMLNSKNQMLCTDIRQVLLNNVSVDYFDKIEVLGIYITKSLSWSAQVMPKRKIWPMFSREKTDMSRSIFFTPAGSRIIFKCPDKFLLRISDVLVNLILYFYISDVHKKWNVIC